MQSDTYSSFTYFKHEGKPTGKETLGKRGGLLIQLALNHPYVKCNIITSMLTMFVENLQTELEQALKGTHNICIQRSAAPKCRGAAAATTE